MCSKKKKKKHDGKNKEMRQEILYEIQKDICTRPHKLLQ